MVGKISVSQPAAMNWDPLNPRKSACICNPVLLCGDGRRRQESHLEALQSARLS